MPSELGVLSYFFLLSHDTDFNHNKGQWWSEPSDSDPSNLCKESEGNSSRNGTRKHRPTLPNMTLNKSGTSMLPSSKSHLPIGQTVPENISLWGKKMIQGFDVEDACHSPYYYTFTSSSISIIHRMRNKFIKHKLEVQFLTT